MTQASDQSNTDLLKGGYDAFARGAVDEVLALFDDDIEWFEAESGPYGGHYHGIDDIVENVFVPLREEWAPFEVHPDRFVEADDTVVALGTYWGTYEKTGKQAEVPFAHEWRFNKRKIVEFHQYTDTALLNDLLAE